LEAGGRLEIPGSLKRQFFLTASSLGGWALAWGGGRGNRQSKREVRERKKKKKKT
jgi:hypothetical protein